MNSSTTRHNGARTTSLGGTLLVIAVAFALPFLNSLRVFIDGVRPHAIPQIAVVAAIVQMLLSLCVLSYVLSQRGLALDDLGLRFSASDVPASVILTVLALLGSRFTYAGEWHLYWELTGHAPPIHPYPSILDAGLTPLVILFIVIDPFVEELIGRAFVIRETHFFTGRSWPGIVISVMLTASYHLYEGWVSIAPVATIFLVFAIYYSKTRRAWPIIAAHLGYDLIVLGEHLHMLGS